MRRMLAALVLLFTASSAQATGLLIPTEKKLPPLAMLNHQVNVAIDDQVAITRIEQTFRNHTDRQLEATYIFPVPKGASVRKFSMWVDGKEVPGELVEAEKARKIYTDIVQRTLDPGLLEYMGNNLLKLRVFPVPPKGDQKISISYTSVSNIDNGLVEYVYPMKTSSKAAQTLEKFSLSVRLKAQHAIQNIYSPTHAITTQRPSDREAVVGFEKEQALLDTDFQLFYTSSAKDVGIIAATHRPNPSQDGFFMMLVSPRAELSKSQQVPRDMVFVLDTSGSMRGKRMTQAQNALKYCVKNLSAGDRFAVINFATTVNRYADSLQEATSDNIASALKWVDGLEATGGTAINDALLTALDMRTTDPARTFTVVFFTDGRPTIGETNVDKIRHNVTKKNTSTTRIFTLGVGDDVNAAMLDQISEESRAVSAYVRESEDIEAKVSSLYGKISNPVLANLKLTVGENVKLSDVYPPQLPDLFHGSQLVVFGRYTGTGHAAVTLSGSVGMDAQQFVYEANFADKTDSAKNFVEDLWARRKVGYLLDQIRVNGEKKELIDEVVALAKRYGITTPYTSYLLVPDNPIPVARGAAPAGTTMPANSPVPDVRFHLNTTPGALGGSGGGAPNKTVGEFLKEAQSKAGDGAGYRDGFNARALDKVPTDPSAQAAGRDDRVLAGLQLAKAQLDNQRQFKMDLKERNYANLQAGRYGVEWSQNSINLRNQNQLVPTAQRWLGNRNCLEVGGVWIDEAYEAKMATVAVKAMSPAYFRILERHPSVKGVFQISNHLVWVTPSGSALVVDTSAGQEEMTDADIDRLFVAQKK
jgi:Ca-activated chloride channel family protein